MRDGASRTRRVRREEQINAKRGRTRFQNFDVVKVGTILKAFRCAKFTLMRYTRFSLESPEDAPHTMSTSIVTSNGRNPNALVLHERRLGFRWSRYVKMQVCISKFITHAKLKPESEAG